MQKETFVLDIKNQSLLQVFNSMVALMRQMVKQGVVVVDFGYKKLTRSNQQNRYFHKLVGLVAEHQGEDAEKVKRQIKHSIGLIEKELINGELITIIKSTADLTVDDFSKLIEETIKICVYLEIDYPVPETYGYTRVAA